MRRVIRLHRRERVVESPQVVCNIVERIADHEGVDPVDIEVPIYDVLEVDALIALMDGTGKRQPPANLQVTFSYYGYTVTVAGNGSVSIVEQQPEAKPGASSREVSGGD